MSKRKYRKGPPITSLDELARQDFVCWWDKPTHNGWFMSWQFRMAENGIRHGAVFYAMPAGVECRFSDEDIIHAELRLGTKPTLEGRTELMQLLNKWDDGEGDIDDTLDRYESGVQRWPF